MEYLINLLISLNPYLIGIVALFVVQFIISQFLPFFFDDEQRMDMLQIKIKVENVVRTLAVVILVIGIAVAISSPSVTPKHRTFDVAKSTKKFVDLNTQDTNTSKPLQHTIKPPVHTDEQLEQDFSKITDWRNRQR